MTGSVSLMKYLFALVTVLTVWPLAVMSEDVNCTHVFVYDKPESYKNYPSLLTIASYYDKMEVVVFGEFGSDSDDIVTVFEFVFKDGKLEKTSRIWKTTGLNTPLGVVYRDGNFIRADNCEVLATKIVDEHDKVINESKSDYKLPVPCEDFCKRFKETRNDTCTYDPYDSTGAEYHSGDYPLNCMLLFEFPNSSTYIKNARGETGPEVVCMKPSEPNPEYSSPYILSVGEDAPCDYNAFVSKLFPNLRVVTDKPPEANSESKSKSTVVSA